MVTSTIMKDTGGSGGSDAIYRPNAIRALCRIIDVGTLNLVGRLALIFVGLNRPKH